MLTFVELRVELEVALQSELEDVVSALLVEPLSVDPVEVDALEVDSVEVAAAAEPVTEVAWFTARAPVIVRKAPALTAAAVRRALRAGCGRRRERSAGVLGGRPAFMGPTMRLEPVSSRRAAWMCSQMPPGSSDGAARSSGVAACPFGSVAPPTTACAPARSLK